MLFIPLYRRLLHALDNRGRIPPPSAQDTLQHPFDLLHATDTGGYLPGETLASNSKADLYNTAYYAISPSTLTQALASLQINPAEHTFIDLGCGKGRALLLATQHGFSNILGIELSPALAATARQNCASHPNIEVRTGDAATLTYPATPIVVFFYHPFLAPQLKQVLTNLTHQRATFHLLSANPGYPKVFRHFPQIHELWTRHFPLSAEDAAHDRHGTTEERYTLWHSA